MNNNSAQPEQSFLNPSQYVANKESSFKTIDGEAGKKLRQEIQSEEQGFMRVHSKAVNYDKKSLFLFSHTSRFRYAIVWLAEWKWFDRLIIFFIFFNSVLLAMYNYGDRDNKTNLNQSLEQLGNILTFIFTAESMIKIAAMGFIFHKNSYLRDAWNWIDFIVVIIGILESVPGMPNLKALRTFRVMRPLRSINAFPAMRMLIVTLFRSIPALANVVGFLAFIFALFGILGVQQYSGVLYNRCRLTEQPLPDGTWPIAEDVGRLCSKTGGGFECPEGTFCGHPLDYGLTLEQDGVLNDDSISFGIVTFDDLGVAMLTIFVSITLEGWTGFMYNLMDADSTIFAIIYFLLLVIFGSFFLLNLILAVIMDSFAQIDQESINKKREIQEQKHCSYFQRKVMARLDVRAQMSAKFKKDLVENENYSIYTEHSKMETKSVGGSEQIGNSVVSSYSQFKRFSSAGVAIAQSPTIPKLPLKDRSLAQSGKLSPKLPPLKTLKLQKSALNDSKSNLLQGDKDEEDEKEEVTDDEENKEQMRAETPNILVMGDGRKLRGDQGESSRSSLTGSQSDQSLIDKPQEESSYENKKYVENLENYKKNLDEIHKGLKRQETGNKKKRDYMEELSKQKLNKFRNFFYKISISNLFSSIITLMIIINTIFLAMDRHPIDDDGQKVLDTGNEIMYWIFLAEMIIKLIGLSPKVYVQDRFNVFDCIIVALSTVEVIMGTMDVENQVSTGGAISAFRALRLLRIFKLARSWKGLQDILMKIGKSLKDISVFSVLLLLVMFVYALLGMQLFAHYIKYNYDGEVADYQDPTAQSPRTNFDDLLHAMITIFVVLIGEDWNSVMYDHMRVSGSAAAAFFVCLVIIGNLIMLNLFLAILLKNFEDTHEERMEKKRLAKEKLQNPIQKQSIIKSLSGKIRSSAKYLLGNQLEVNNSKETSKSGSLKVGSIAPAPSSKNVLQRQPTNDRRSGQSLSGNSIYSKFRQAMEQKIQSKMSTTQLLFNKQQSIRNIEVNMDDLQGRSLFLFKSDNKLRVFLSKASNSDNKKFENIILAFIILSTISMATETPLDDPNGLKIKILNVIDYVFSGIFIIEMLMKVISRGFIINGPRSYIKSPWNQLDFIIVMFSIVSIIFSDGEFGFIKVLRMLRVLRPLRMISRNEGLKVAVTSLINSVPGILNVFVVSFLFFILFGILGVNYFKGNFQYCVLDSEGEEFLQMNVFTVYDCYDYGGAWANMDAKFDNIGEAVLTLFEIATTEGWTGNMWAGVDGIGPGMQPQRDYSIGHAAYHIAFIIIGSLFIINQFVGVVINTFNDEKEKLGQNDLLTPTQKEWVAIQILCFKSKPIKKQQEIKNPFRKWFYNFVTHSWFDFVILACIILNTLVLGVKWYNYDQIIPDITEIINYVFAAIFTIEAIFKIIGMGKFYFKDGWCIFDFVIVIGTFVSFIITVTTDVEIGSQTTIIRAFRIGRVLRLVRKAKSLKMIFNTLLITIPSLANVGGLMTLLIFMYSILGTFLFGEVMQENQSELSIHANFTNFGQSFLTLMRISTGEAWNSIMRDVSRSRSITFDCIPSPTFQDYLEAGQPVGCGNSVSAVLYFLSFMIIVTFVFLNLFIAIILQGFNDTNDKESLKVSEETIDEFNKIWVNFDPDGTGFISIHSIKLFLRTCCYQELSLTPGLEKIILNDKQLEAFVMDLHLPSYHNFKQFHYYNVLHSLIKFKFRHECEKSSFRLLKQNTDKKEHKKQEKEQKKLFQLGQDSMSISGTDEKKDSILTSDSDSDDGDNFDQEMQDFEDKQTKYKIALMESMQKQMQKSFKKILPKVDQFDQFVYDSKHLLLFIKIKNRILHFLKRVKEGNVEWYAPRQEMFQIQGIEAVGDSQEGSSMAQNQSSALFPPINSPMTALTHQSLISPSQVIQQNDQIQHQAAQILVADSYSNKHLFPTNAPSVTLKKPSKLQRKQSPRFTNPKKKKGPLYLEKDNKKIMFDTSIKDQKKKRLLKKKTTSSKSKKSQDEELKTIQEVKEPVSNRVSQFNTNLLPMNPFRQPEDDEVNLGVSAPVSRNSKGNVNALPPSQSLQSKPHKSPSGSRSGSRSRIQQLLCVDSDDDEMEDDEFIKMIYGNGQVHEDEDHHHSVSQDNDDDDNFQQTNHDINDDIMVINNSNPNDGTNFVEHRTIDRVSGASPSDFTPVQTSDDDNQMPRNFPTWRINQL